MLMRKLITIFLSFLLIGSTSGIAISKHFCGELLQEVSISAKDMACCEQEDTPEDCCSNETALLKAEDFQLTQHNVNLAFVPYVLFAISFPDFNFTTKLLFNTASGILHHSPPLPNGPIFIQVQSFLL